MIQPDKPREEPHTHPYEQMVVVLEGTMVMSIDEDEIDVPAGSAIIIPALARHTAWSKDGKLVRQIGVFAPVRKDYAERSAHQDEQYADPGKDWIKPGSKSWT